MHDTSIASSFDQKAPRSRATRPLDPLPRIAVASFTDQAIDFGANIRLGRRGGQGREQEPAFRSWHDHNG